MQTVFIVGQYKRGDFPDVVWEFQGVFDSVERAIAACKTEDYFVGVTQMNDEMPHETVAESENWAWYPLLEDMPDAIASYLEHGGN